MSKKIIIVESPSKVKILNSFLPNNYNVTSCYGHIRNITPKSKQVYLQGKEVIANWYYLPSVKKLHEFVGKHPDCKEIIIATDPDREGERIAMDLSDLWVKDYKIQRVTFNAITKDEVLKAIKNPRQVDINKANAAKARAIIDYYFGFNISPWLWKVLPQAKSMGRVQAPSLHWLIEREIDNLTREIESYCTVSLINERYGVTLNYKYPNFSEFYTSIRGSRLNFHNLNRKTRTSTSKCIDPFNTLTIQKYINGRYKISAQSLMRYLQDLYAGKISDLKGQSLITYMRTDSIRLSVTFVRKTIIYLLRNGLKDQINWEQIKYLMVNKDKNAQDAHEAIRPISFSLKNLKGYYHRIMFSIIQRTLQAFIVPSVYNIHRYQLEWGNVVFSSTDIKELLKSGNNEFLSKQSYKIPIDTNKLRDDTSWRMRLNFQTNLNYKNYSEGNLISSMQKLGVGRPSTWSQIRFNLNRRSYIDGKMKPESLGFLTENLMKVYFNEFTLNEFTNYVEEKLDEIENLGKNYEMLLSEILLFINKKIDQVQKVDWAYLLEYLRLRNKRYCCNHEAKLYFSKKKRVWLFFRCEQCGGILPFDYKPLAVRSGNDNGFIKTFLWRGRVISKNDTNGNNFLSKIEI